MKVTIANRFHLLGELRISLLGVVAGLTGQLAGSKPRFTPFPYTFGGSDRTSLMQPYKMEGSYLVTLHLIPTPGVFNPTTFIPVAWTAVRPLPLTGLLSGCTLLMKVTVANTIQLVGEPWISLLGVVAGLTGQLAGRRPRFTPFPYTFGGSDRTPPVQTYKMKVSYLVALHFWNLHWVSNLWRLHGASTLLHEPDYGCEIRLPFGHQFLL